VCRETDYSGPWLRACLARQASRVRVGRRTNGDAAPRRGVGRQGRDAIAVIADCFSPFLLAAPERSVSAGVGFGKDGFDRRQVKRGERRSRGFGGRAMEIGTFSKHTLLTGAGWSHNWGARLAADVWQLLMDDPAVTGNERLRAVLLEEGSFEVALAKTQAPPFTSDERESFEHALTNAFISMDSAMIHDYHPSTWINIYKVQELLFRLAGQRGQGFGTAYLFTLNQDLFFERYLYNQHVSGAPAQSLPGIQPPGVPIFTTNVGQYSNQFIMRPSADPAGDGRLQGQFNIIKLHGSFNWRTPDARNLMVVGTEKTTQIASLPLLSWYFDIFKTVLFSGGVRLMIVGYGFADEHINATIAEAVENHGLKVLIWAKGSNLRDHIIASPHGPVIWKGLLGGTVTQTMIEVFPSNQEVTAEYRRIRRVFFGDEQIR